MVSRRVMIFLLGITWGPTTMSYETTFNQKTREEFKKSINYPALVAQNVPAKEVNIEWAKSFKNIIDRDGNEWEVNATKPVLGQWGEGEMRATLQSGKGKAIIVIISLSDNWKQRLDYVIWTKSLTNRAEVNLKLLPGFDDIYLVPKDTPGVSSTSFLYGNVYVSIKQWDAGDIDALAKAIYQLVKNNSQPVAEVKPAFKVNADKCQLNTGDTVKIKVEGLAKNWNSEWIYNQPQMLLGDELEYIEQDGDTFHFKTVKTGKLEVTFAALNTRTLYVEKQSVTLEIR